MACRWLAYQLRFDFFVTGDASAQLQNHWHWVVALQLCVLALFGQFTGIYRYFSLPDLERLALAMGLSGFILYAIRFAIPTGYSPPRGVILVQIILGFLALAALRVGWRKLHESYFSRKNHTSARVKPVAIIGAGDAASSLIGDLRAHPRLGLVPIVLFDDAVIKHGSQLHGIRVAGAPESILKVRQKYPFEQAIIAMPTAPAQRIKEVVSLLQRAKISFVTVPGMDQLTAGTATITQLRPVNIDDLLGREPVQLEADSLRESFQDKVIMVTGAGGSIGSEICRQLVALNPGRLLLVDQSEVQLFQIEQELVGRGAASLIVPLVGNILDETRMRQILGQWKPAVLFHAAAHKHVPLMESQPAEAVKNNSLGTARLADLALEYQVERFLMISTDKAVNPTSTMGASKRLAEVYLQALSASRPGGTKFIAVRFGNVLGSSGSVVPTFTRQIAQGGPVTVTHPDMVRYFMTIPEAVGLVLQSCAQGKGGEIFVLDMGKPVKIADLARQMIELSGKIPDVDIEIKYVGLRPGEKLFEELNCHGENHRPTRHPRILSFVTTPHRLSEVEAVFKTLEAGFYTLPPAQLKKGIQQLVPEYTPFL